MGSIYYMSMFDFNGKNNLHWGDYKKKCLVSWDQKKPLEKNKKQIWSVSLMLLQNIFEKKKKNVIFFKNKLKKRSEKTNPSFCKKPHSMWKIEKGLGKKNTEKLKIEKREKKKKKKKKS